MADFPNTNDPEVIKWFIAWDLATRVRQEAAETAEDYVEGYVDRIVRIYKRLHKIEQDVLHATSGNITTGSMSVE